MLAFEVNAAAPELIAKTSADHRFRLLQVSTDYVSDGRGNGFYA